MTLADLDKKYQMFSEAASSYDSKKFTFSLSDDIVAKGFQATAGSRMLEGHYPVFDSTVASRMYGAGGTLIGKTNMDEFGSGMFSVTCAKIPKNPLDQKRSCGGPCGGAAAAAAIIEDHVALATSVRGGISIPAAFCGVYGLTPTQGRVSRHGQIDSVSSMGPIGIISSDPKLLKKYLPVISGKDANDPVSAAQPELRTGKKKLRTAAIPKGITDGVSADVLKAFNDSVETLKGMSVDVEYVDMPLLKYADAAHYILFTTEIALNLATYCGMRVGRQDGDMSLPFDDFFTSARSKYFGQETKADIIAGTYMTLGENRKKFYLRSLGIRQLILDGFRRTLKDFDAVVTPSTPFTAPKFDEIGGKDAGRFAVPPVFCGLPCVSVPCSGSGMPAGIQFIADHWDEDVLLSAAEMCADAFAKKKGDSK